VVDEEKVRMGDSECSRGDGEAVKLRGLVARRMS